MQLEQKIAVKMDDGSVKLFDTKAEAMEYLQRPKQTEAFEAFVGDNPDLITWLLDNRSEVESAFESAKIKRVIKSEKNALKKSLDAIKAAEDKAFAFVVEHSEAILNSFRWPSVKRGSEEVWRRGTWRTQNSDFGQFHIREIRGSQSDVEIIDLEQWIMKDI